MTSPLVPLPPAKSRRMRKIMRDYHARAFGEELARSNQARHGGSRIGTMMTATIEIWEIGLFVKFP